MDNKTKPRPPIKFRASSAVAADCDVEGGETPNYVPQIVLEFSPNGAITLEAYHTGTAYYTRGAARSAAANLIKTIRAALEARS